MLTPLAISTFYMFLNAWNGSRFMGWTEGALKAPRAQFCTHLCAAEMSKTSQIVSMQTSPCRFENKRSFPLHSVGTSRRLLWITFWLICKIHLPKHQRISYIAHSLVSGLPFNGWLFRRYQYRIKLSTFFLLKFTSCLLGCYHFNDKYKQKQLEIQFRTGIPIF